jgi:hypothetical protein
VEETARILVAQTHVSVDVDGVGDSRRGVSLLPRETGIKRLAPVAGSLRRLATLFVRVAGFAMFEQAVTRPALSELLLQQVVRHDADSISMGDT